MPPRGDAAELIDSMPFDLQLDLRAYVRALEQSIPEIFCDIDVRVTEPIRQEFLYLATLRKTWNFVDSQYVALRESLRVLGRYGVAEVAIGASRYGPESEEYSSVVSLRSGLRRTLVQSGMFELVAFSTLADLAARAAGRRGRA